MTYICYRLIILPKRIIYPVLLNIKNKFPLRSHGTSLGAIYSFGSLGFRLFILLPFPSF